MQEESGHDEQILARRRTTARCGRAASVPASTALASGIKSRYDSARMDAITPGSSRESLLADFADWAARHIKGDEKGEAQIFLDHLFRAFGQKGSLDVGGTAEMRIRKATQDRWCVRAQKPVH